MSILNVNAGLSGSMSQSLNNISNINRLANDSISRINSGLKFTHISDAPATVIQAQGLQSDIDQNSSHIDDNNYTIGQFDGVLKAQDEIVSLLNDMSSLQESYNAEADAGAKSVLSDEYDALANSITAIAQGATYKDSAVLSSATTKSEGSFGTAGSVTLSFIDSTATGLSVGTGTIATGDIKAAITNVSKNSAGLSGYRKLFESANSVMASSNTAWAQSYNDLIKVNDAEESALLTSLSNQAAAANAALSYQAQFYNISSGTSFTA